MSSTLRWLGMENLNADLMYDAVKKHEAYMAHHQLPPNQAYSVIYNSHPSSTHAPVGGHFKSRFQRPSAHVAAAVEDLGLTPVSTLSSRRRKMLRRIRLMLPPVVQEGCSYLNSLKIFLTVDS